MFIVTGEASGDTVGAELARHMLGLRPGLELSGIGASRMEAAGVTLWANSGQWAAIGVAQALPMVATMLALQRRLKRHLAAHRPDVLVLVDFGAFNVRLGTWARENGIRTVYLMPSGSWRRAAKPERLKKLAASADLFLTPFRWNAENLRGVGANARHIGHPVLDFARPSERSQEVVRQKWEGGRLIALLPGSRRHEVDTLGPRMIAAARAWPEPKDRFVMVRAPSFGEAEFARRVGLERGGERVIVTDARAADVFAACDLAVVCSGTATLEAAAALVPMVVVYDGPRVMRAEWRMRRRFLHIEHIAMPNVIAGRRIVPELIAEDASPESIVAALKAYADDPAVRAETVRALSEVRDDLRPDGALETAARAIVEAAGL